MELGRAGRLVSPNMRLQGYVCLVLIGRAHLKGLGKSSTLGTTTRSGWRLATINTISQKVDCCCFEI